MVGGLEYEHLFNCNHRIEARRNSDCDTRPHSAVPTRGRLHTDWGISHSQKIGEYCMPGDCDVNAAKKVAEQLDNNEVDQATQKLSECWSKEGFGTFISTVKANERRGVGADLSFKIGMFYGRSEVISFEIK